MPTEFGRHVAAVVRAGQTCAFSFNCDPRSCPNATAAVRFTDDAGLHWQINHDLHLAELDKRTDW